MYPFTIDKSRAVGSAEVRYATRLEQDSDWQSSRPFTNLAHDATGRNRGRLVAWDIAVGCRHSRAADGTKKGAGRACGYAEAAPTAFRGAA